MTWLSFLDFLRFDRFFAEFDVSGKLVAGVIMMHGYWVPSLAYPFIGRIILRNPVWIVKLLLQCYYRLIPLDHVRKGEGNCSSDFILYRANSPHKSGASRRLSKVLGYGTHSTQCLNTNVWQVS